MKLTNFLMAGLERTDNGMKQTSWPEVSMINQKNYYTFVNHKSPTSPSDLVHYLFVCFFFSIVLGRSHCCGVSFSLPVPYLDFDLRGQFWKRRNPSTLLFI
jgi:hypothetical protein